MSPPILHPPSHPTLSHFLAPSSRSIFLQLSCLLISEEDFGSGYVVPQNRQHHAQLPDTQAVGQPQPLFGNFHFQESPRPEQHGSWDVTFSANNESLNYESPRDYALPRLTTRERFEAAGTHVVEGDSSHFTDNDPSLELQTRSPAPEEGYRSFRLPTSPSHSLRNTMAGNSTFSSTSFTLSTPDVHNVSHSSLSSSNSFMQSTPVHRPPYRGYRLSTDPEGNQLELPPLDNLIPQQFDEDSRDDFSESSPLESGSSHSTTNPIDAKGKGRADPSPPTGLDHGHDESIAQPHSLQGPYPSAPRPVHAQLPQRPIDVSVNGSFHSNSPSLDESSHIPIARSYSYSRPSLKRTRELEHAEHTEERENHPPFSATTTGVDDVDAAMTAQDDVNAQDDEKEAEVRNDHSSPARKKPRYALGVSDNLPPSPNVQGSRGIPGGRGIPVGRGRNLRDRSRVVSGSASSGTARAAARATTTSTAGNTIDANGKAPVRGTTAATRSRTTSTTQATTTSQPVPATTSGRSKMSIASLLASTPSTSQPSTTTTTAMTRSCSETTFVAPKTRLIVNAGRPASRAGQSTSTSTASTSTATSKTTRSAGTIKIPAAAARAKAKAGGANVGSSVPSASDASSSTSQPGSVESRFGFTYPMPPPGLSTELKQTSGFNPPWLLETLLLARGNAAATRTGGTRAAVSVAVERRVTRSATRTAANANATGGQCYGHDTTATSSSTATNTGRSTATDRTTTGRGRATRTVVPQARTGANANSTHTAASSAPNGPSQASSIAAAPQAQPSTSTATATALPALQPNQTVWV
ncbi:hypothetical protein D9758_016065 [Tetrapyrgos nigripes]|uniref:Uncharacterized protein n=1 Tax=Tetrapyrgos nigripes TaxID=182062 RepID=A0A8H5C3L7_9AGAR|nr:hypothetical protein D9758_016065 [Tetrapyrgos nigripes]